MQAFRACWESFSARADIPFAKLIRWVEACAAVSSTANKINNPRDETMLKRHTIAAALGLCVTGVAFSFFAATPAAAADAAQEIATAAKHAGLAGNSGGIDAVHAHLHHTLNCLEGPKGANFDAKEMNPCEGMGAGAIPDTADAATKTALEAAAREAAAGVAEKDLATAQAHARSTEVMLNKIGK
jgi:hypothetical protein